MTIRDLQDHAAATAKTKGFSEGPVDVDRALLLVVGELVEAQNDLRDGYAINERYYEGEKPCGFGIELADAAIRIAHLAARCGIDLQTEIENKLDYNEGRPYKHGKAF